jgi:ligand-binding sensor domain-containing protein
MLAVVFTALLAGCLPAAPISPVDISLVTATEAPAVLDPPAATATPAPAPTATPVLTPDPTAVPQVEEPAPDQPRFPSGWGFYSNPDFVQGMAIQQGTLWVASLGGVTSWDLETGQPMLYTPRDGLVEIQSNDVVYCPAPQERIFVAHESSMLSVYDLQQQKWMRMPITFEDGSAMQSVQRLLCDARNNRLVAGSAQGLGILSFETGKWQRIGEKEGLFSSTILALEAAGQSIWVAAGDKSIYQVVGKAVFPYSVSNSLPRGPVYDVTVDSEGSLWMAYPTTLVRYKDKRWNAFGANNPVNIPFSSVIQVEAGKDDIVWIASADQGVCPFNRTRLYCATIYPSLDGFSITTLVVDAAGTAYAGTSGGGVLVLTADQVTNLAHGTGELISNDVLDIAESADGRLWIATGIGVNVFDPAQPAEPWQVIRPSRGRLAFPRVSGLQPVAEGMWFFYENESQASFYDGESWLQIDPYKGLASPVLDSAQDQRGYIWLAAQQGIHIWDGSTMRSYGPSTGLPGSTFHAVFERGGEMWVGTDRGLLHYQRFQWQSLLPDIAINAIAADKPGGLLLGTNQGLIRYIDGQSYQWLLNLGGEVITSVRVTTISWDLAGHLWVGTDGDGLFHYDGKQWERFDTTSGMPTNRIRKVFTDSTGTVWIVAATGKGGGALVRYTP